MLQSNNLSLSDKSNALSLLKLMSIDPIRDEIIYWLSPKDVVEFVIATGIVFEQNDMCVYTNIFKHFISDRRWLIDKINEGYTFTIIGRRLNEIVTGIRHTVNNEYNDNHPFMNNEWSVMLILIVTKNNNVIPCDNRFMSRHVFLNSQDERHQDIVHIDTGYPTRCIRKISYGLKIDINCILESGSTSNHIFVCPKICGDSFADSYDNCHVAEYATTYIHANKLTSKIVGPIYPISDDEHTDSTTNHLFSVKIQPSPYSAHGSRVFHIPK